MPLRGRSWPPSSPEIARTPLPLWAGWIRPALPPQADPDGGEPKRAGVSLLELRPGQCRFIVDERASPVRFCGEPAVAGASWCAVHRRVVYVPASVRAQRS